MSNKVTYSDIIAALANATGNSKQKSDEFTKALIQLVKRELTENGKASITNFGSFEVKEVAEREGKNPQTGEPITIPAHNRVAFSPYKALREKVNAPYAHLEPTLIEEETAREYEEETETDTAGEQASVEEPEEDQTSLTEPGTEEAGDDPFGLEDTAEEPRRKAPFEFDEDSEEEEEKEEEETRETIAEEGGETLEESEGEDEADEQEQEEPEEQVEAPSAEVRPDQPSAPVFSTSRKQKKEPNTQLIVFSILLIVVIAIAAGWFFMGGDDSQEPVAAENDNAAQQAPVRAEPEPEQETQADPQQAEEPAAATEASPASGEADESSEEDNAPAENEAPEETEAAAPALEEQTLTQAKLTEYDVKKDEWFWVISEKIYGKSFLWPLIFEANLSADHDPDRLIPSRGLVIPAIEGRADQLSKSDYRQLAAATMLVSEAYANHGKQERADEYALFAKKYEKKAAGF